MQECIRRKIEVGEFFVNKTNSSQFARVERVIHEGGDSFIDGVTMIDGYNSIVYTFYDLQENTGQRERLCKVYFLDEYESISKDKIYQSKYGEKFRNICLREKEILSAIESKKEDIRIDKDKDLKFFSLSFDADARKGKNFSSLKTFDWCLEVIDDSYFTEYPVYRFCYLCDDYDPRHEEERGKVRGSKRTVKSIEKGFLNYPPIYYSYNNLYPISDFTDDEKEYAYTFLSLRDDPPYYKDVDYGSLVKKFIKGARLYRMWVKKDLEKDKIMILNWDRKGIDEENLKTDKWTISIQRYFEGNPSHVIYSHEKGSDKVEERYYRDPLYLGHDFRTIPVKEFLFHCGIDKGIDTILKREGKKISAKDLVYRMILKTQKEKLKLKNPKLVSWHTRGDYRDDDFGVITNSYWTIKLEENRIEYHIDYGFLNHFDFVHIYDYNKDTDKEVCNYKIKIQDMIDKFAGLEKHLYRLEV